MNLIRAETKAKGLLKVFLPFCDRIEVVGKIRRRKEPIDNIDILLAPKSALLFELMGKIVALGSEDGIKVANKKTILLKDELEEIMVNLWFTTISKWPTMLFIKTGGNKSVQRIGTLCKDKKWQFSVNEAAIFDENGRKLLIEKEEDIFTLLGVSFIEPSWRE